MTDAVRHSPYIIATGFVADTPETASEFPSAGQDSSDPAFQAIYWRCIVVMLLSSRLSNPDARTILFCNVSPPVLNGVDIGMLLQNAEVEIVILALTHRLPGNETKWGSVFYCLDVIEWASHNAPEATLLLLDSDVVITGRVHDLFESVRNKPLGFYPISYQPDHNVNGLTPKQLGAFVTQFTAQDPEDNLSIFGGELLLVNIPHFIPSAPLVRDLWMKAYTQGKAKLSIRTEEHFWTALIAMHNIEFVSAATFVKRMWTSLRFRNVLPGDQDTPIWHLPAEKRFGFQDMYSTLVKSNLLSDFDAASFKQFSMTVFGIPSRSPRKILIDNSRRFFRILIKKLQRRSI